MGAVAECEDASGLVQAQQRTRPARWLPPASWERPARQPLRPCLQQARPEESSSAAGPADDRGAGGGRGLAGRSDKVSLR